MDDVSGYATRVVAESNTQSLAPLTNPARNLPCKAQTLPSPGPSQRAQICQPLAAWGLWAKRQPEP
ncbi:unnamed protein product [Fusarium graminearum]|nr:unnamed protein product [Fusarium graminearum]CAG1960427.1 unnamed protein product [Fusarium graminearum]